MYKDDLEFIMSKLRQMRSKEWLESMEIAEEERLKRGVIDWEYILTPIVDNINRNTDNLLSSRNADRIYYKEEILSEREKLDSVLRLMRDKYKVERIEALSKDIATWSRESNDGPSWSEIAGCLLKEPTSVEFDYEECPECGGKTFKCYFRTAEYIRAKGGGCSGYMTICPHCHNRVWQSNILK